MVTSSSKFGGGKELIEELTQQSRQESEVEQIIRTGRTFPSGGGGGEPTPTTPTPEPEPIPEPTQEISPGATLALERIEAGEPITPANVLALQAEARRGGFVHGMPTGTNIQSGIESFIGSQQVSVPQEQKKLSPPIGVVSAAPDQPGLFGVQQKIQRERRMLATREMGGATVLGGIKDIGLGFSSTLVGAGIFGQQLVTSPIQTVKAIPGGLASEFKAIRGGSLATKLRESPGFVGGELLGEVVVFKGAGKVIKTASKGVQAGRTVVSPKFRPIQTLETGEKIIVDIPKVGELGLIPPGKGLAKEGAATVRGGFGFTKAEQSKFIGVEGVATSQRDLTKLSQRVLGKPVPIKEVEKGFGLFATPADPLTKRLQTRISRLGETPKEAGIKDLLAGDFTLKAPKPEILLFPEERVGRPGGFQPFGKPSTELEVTTVPPRLGGAKGFEVTGTPAVTLIEGKRVPIRTARLTTFVEEPIVQPIETSRIKIKPTRGRESTSELISQPVLPTRRVGTSAILTGLPKITSVISPPTKIVRRGISTKVPSPKIPSFPVPDIASPDIPSPRRGVSPLTRPSTPVVSPPVLDLPRFVPSKAPPLTGFPPLGSKGKKLKIKGKRKLRRTPSTISAALDIGETPFGFGTQEEMSGLITRGLIKPKKKRKKSR